MITNVKFNSLHTCTPGGISCGLTGEGFLFSFFLSSNCHPSIECHFWTDLLYMFLVQYNFPKYQWHVLTSKRTKHKLFFLEMKATHWNMTSHPNFSAANYKVILQFHFPMVSSKVTPTGNCVLSFMSHFHFNPHLTNRIPHNPQCCNSTTSIKH